MKKKIIVVSLVLVLLTSLVVLGFSNTDSEQKTQYEVNERVYVYKDIKVRYPQISGLIDDKKQDKINNLIKEKAISVYEELLSDLERGQIYEVDGNYEIKLQSDKILSIAYSSFNNITPSAYPYSIFYTTNIDIENQKELIIKDFIPTIDEDFIKILKKGKYVGPVDMKYQEQLRKFVFSNYPNEDDLIEVIKKSYIYTTEDIIGISIPVPHVAGDYFILEISKDEL